MEYFAIEMMPKSLILRKTSEGRSLRITALTQLLQWPTNGDGENSIQENGHDSMSVPQFLH